MLKKLGTQNFVIDDYGPLPQQEQSRICLSDRSIDNHSIYFTRDKIPELIELLKAADQHFEK